MRSVLVQLSLALLGMFLAYLAWIDGRDPASIRGEVVILECAPEQLRSILLRGEGSTVRVQLEDDAEPWITLSESAAEGGVGARREARFLGGPGVAAYFADVAPLRALRALGSIDPDGLEELGLEHPRQRLTIECDAKEHTFEIGEAAYGSGSRYVRAAGDPEIYLLASGLIRRLEAAEHGLMQRQLHRFEASQIASLTLEAGNRSRELLHRNRQDPADARWVDAERPDRVETPLDQWVNQVHRLQAQAYLPAGPPPPGERLLSIRYEDAQGEAIGELELRRVEGVQGLAYVARTEITEVWVQLPASLVREIEAGLPSVLP
ncbi:MAG: DUF4340 domain-containing protein [Myxococcales bacterium]|nr:DUF4340 domain-containing protein [Myxococcales bacterium]